MKRISRALRRLSLVTNQKKFNPLALGIFAVIIGGGGLYILLSRAAPTPPSIYLSPVSATIGPNGTFTVQVRENSGTTGVNALQANFSYPTSLVSCSGITTTASAFGVEAQSSCTGGQVNIGRGVTGGSAPLTGDQLVATVTFTANTTGGAVNLAFTSGTVLVSATTNQDILGSLAATAGGTYTIDTTQPTATVTAPTASSFIGGTSVTVSATASDTSGIAGVQFKLDGANLGTEDTSSPYSITWNTSGATNGTHSLTAVARDSVGNTATSSSVSVTVDNAAPSVSITAPSANTTVNGTATITAASSDNTGGSGVAKVEFYIDGSLKSTDTTSPYSYAWDTTTATNGTHSLTAKSYDKITAANAATSAAVNVTVNNADTQAPTTPGNLHLTGSGLTSLSFAWNASTDNSSVSGYQIKRDGTLVATVSGLSYTNSGLTTATTYSYTVTAIDAAGNMSAAAGPISGTTLTPTAGDVNSDGKVDITDLSLMLSHYGTVFSSCDLNHDGQVNILDLSILLTHFGA